MEACGVTAATTPALHQTAFYTSHEALLLGYEQALTRSDSTTGSGMPRPRICCGSGTARASPTARTSSFLRGVGNPVGMKVGPEHHGRFAAASDRATEPRERPGRLMLISRMGANSVREALAPLVRAVAREGRTVVWSCDPMHGNTIKAGSGYKTRVLEQILEEVQGFFEVHRAEGTHAGGIHVEMTGQTSRSASAASRKSRKMDCPAAITRTATRVFNASQSIELAFRIAQMLRTERERRRVGPSSRSALAISGARGS